MVFNSHANLHSTLITSHANPTLANLRDAQDQTITALPLPPSHSRSNTAEKPKKKSIWRRALNKVKKMLQRGRKEHEMVIGEPTDFRHVASGGVTVRERDSGWEDVDSA